MNEIYICSYSVDLMGVSEEKKGGTMVYYPVFYFAILFHLTVFQIVENFYNARIFSLNETWLFYHCVERKEEEKMA